jgi:hypothetical protein
MIGDRSSSEERVRVADPIAMLSLATDLAVGLPLSHGLGSTLVAMRLGESWHRLPTASHTYYAHMLFQVGCTAEAELAAEILQGRNARASHARGVRVARRVGARYPARVARPGRPPLPRAWRFVGRKAVRSV